MNTDVFVVTNTGDAPVLAREVVTADGHALLTKHYALTGYAAEPAVVTAHTAKRLRPSRRKKRAVRKRAAMPTQRVEKDTRAYRITNGLDPETGEPL